MCREDRVALADDKYYSRILKLSVSRQCPLCELPQLFGQYWIFCCAVQASGGVSANRLVKSSIFNCAFLACSCPQSIIGTFVRFDHLPYASRMNEGFVSKAKPSDQPGIDNTWVHRDSCQLFAIATRKLRGVKYVGQLGLPVAVPATKSAEILGRLQILEHNTTFWMTTEAKARKYHDPDIGGGGLGGSKQCRHQELDDQGVTKVIGGELDLIAVFRKSWRLSHDSGVAYQDIESNAGKLRLGSFDRSHGE